MRISTRSEHDLYVLDLAGQRDEAWLDGFGFGRAIVRQIGTRCLTCGRRLFTMGQPRIYCDDTCQRRHLRRRERFRKYLRDEGATCPYCRHKP